MATPAARRRLTREYSLIQASPPPYIIAHPSESDILEWHYILTGPPNTPYEFGQYWGTLVFPPDYPFAPPAIRMHTPSGRFQPSSKLCLSISDFHPKSFNPAWSVSTILIGLLSFMSSEEMTAGSVGGTVQERKFLAARSRWWNSTGNGSCLVEPKTTSETDATTTQQQPPKGGRNNVRAGDGGAKFRYEWPELDVENWRWMREHKIDAKTGKVVLPDDEDESKVVDCSPETAALRRTLGGVGGTRGGVVGAVVEGGRRAGRGWLAERKWWIAAGVLFTYVLVSRIRAGGLDAIS